MLKFDFMRIQYFLKGEEESFETIQSFFLIFSMQA